jgi:Skp family chaperone for outer membrane proteins
MKRFALVLAAALVTVLPIASWAEIIGVVDLDKVMSNYSKAQSVMADIKVREAELRKLQADYSKQVEDARKTDPKSPVASSQLEKDLTAKLGAKVNEYRDWTATQQKAIDVALETSIRDAAKARSVEVVISKQAVFQGGIDITNDILTRLNK